VKKGWKAGRLEGWKAGKLEGGKVEGWTVEGCKVKVEGCN